MPLLQALVLGIVQGATEYIPVSSSAHLVLVPWLLGWPDAPFSFEVLVQWGTLIGVFVYFWRDLWNVTTGLLTAVLRGRPFDGEDARLGWMIVLGTIPAVIIGLLLKDVFESAYSQPLLVAGLLLVTGAMLAGAERYGRPATGPEGTWVAGCFVHWRMAGGGASPRHQPQWGDDIGCCRPGI